MAKPQGTFEALALELGRALTPLKTRLADGEIKSFFADLGLTLPGTTPLPPGVVTALGGTIDALAQLPPLIAQLEQAITAEDTVGVVSAGVALTKSVAALVTSLQSLGVSMNGASGSFPGVPPADVAAFAGQLAERVAEYALLTYLEGSWPKLTTFLRTIGIADLVHDPGVPSDPLKPPTVIRSLHLDRLGQLLTKPLDHFGTLYGWSSPSFDAQRLLEVIRDALFLLSVPANLSRIGPSNPLKDLEIAPFRLVPEPTVNPRGVSLRFDTPLANDLSFAIPIADSNWKLGLAVKGALGPSVGILFQPPMQASLVPSGALGVKLTLENRPPQPMVLLAIDAGSRVQLDAFNAFFELEVAGAPAAVNVGAGLKGGKIIIDASESDGFLQKILSGVHIESNFDLGIGFSSTQGIYFNGSSALEIQLPLHVGLGPISVEALTIGIKPQGGAITITLGADIKGELGPLVAVVQNMGVAGTLTFPPNHGGNLGPLNLALGFKPPTGVGLSLDVGIIKGGGFLSINVDKGEYVGAMELDFLGIISLKAIAIINTKLPDGSSGFSLLIIITADFPPIQLGFGFTLNAVGGLLGLNRTVNMDALREGVRTNAIKSILFPQDVIANITRIVSDLKQIFPPLNEHFTVGPMAKLGWGTPSIITLELGILLELPVPRIAILGVLKAFLPAEEFALLRIQVNFLGVIDFENKYISFDASLFDSRLLIYTLTGDMAFRLSWGDHPMFILSVGGFHPAYHDAPQDLQHMTRLGISLLSGDNPRISVLSYFAVTSNTVQFGARAELYAEAAGFNVYGFIGYDVLFQFDPFKFVASFEAGLALREGTSTIMGIHLAGQLSGINPWNARGEASITILFFDITVSFDETWGDSATKIEPAKEDILARLTTEIHDNRNWHAEIPDGNNLHVSIRKIELPPDQIVIHPMGVLTFSERLVPLGLDITKFGNKVPLDAKRFEIKATDPGILTQNVTEEFAPANFFDKSDNEKLSSPSFDRMTSGFKVTGATSLVMPTAVNKSVEYELTYLHKARTQRTRAVKYLMAKHVFQASTKASAVATSTLSYARNRVSVNAPESVALQPPAYGIANVSDMRLAGPDLVASSYTEAAQKLSALVARRPELRDQVQILTQQELNGT